MNGSAINSTAICILGVHRSGTSTVARAVNLLGAYLGKEEELMAADSANPEGYWERLDVCRLQDRLLGQLKRSWDSSAPLPDQWHLAPEVRPFRDELKQLVANHFAQHPLWAWKDPRSCVLLPLWRSVLDELGIRLLCIFVVRSPLDVAKSLKKRDYIPIQKGFGIWFNYSIAALQDAAGAPTVLLSYDSFLESWEPELRKCAAALHLAWPTDEQPLQAAMNAFIRPGLRHSQSTPRQLEGAPRPVRELYELLLDTIQHPAPPEERFRQTIARLARDFQDYATFFQSDLEQLLLARISRGAGVDVGFVMEVTGNVEQTARCLDSLNRAGIPDAEIVVVDNASADGTREFLAGRPQLRVIVNKTNLGRGAAWNQGVEATYATWIVVLTNDVIVAPGFREGLTGFIQQKHRDIVSPAMGEGELDYELLSFSETFLNKMGSAFRRDVAWDCSFMVHRRVFHAMGLFDTQPALAGKEAKDFFRRASERGFRLAVTGRAYLHHLNGCAPCCGTAQTGSAQSTAAGDIDYYAKKHHLSWRRHQAERLRDKARSIFWRWNESRRYGMTLRMRRQRGEWRSV